MKRGTAGTWTAGLLVVCALLLFGCGSGTVEERLADLEHSIEMHASRLTVLECEHDPQPDTETRIFSGTYVTLSGCVAYVERCSKCGTILRDLTEREYLEMRIEGIDSTWSAEKEELERRLLELCDD